MPRLTSKPVAGSASRIVVALEKEGPAHTAAERMLYTGNDMLLDTGVRQGYSYNPVTRSLDPSPDGSRKEPLAGHHSWIDIVGRGHSPGSGSENKVSNLSGTEVGQLLSSVIPQGPVRAINVVASHAGAVSGPKEGVLTSGFLHDLLKSLAPHAGDTSVFAYPGNIAVDKRGEVRSLVETSNGWRTWEAPYGLHQVEAKYGKDGQIHYSQKVDQFVPPPGEELIREGLPDPHAQSLQLHNDAHLKDLSSRTRSDALNNHLDLSDVEDQPSPGHYRSAVPSIVDQRTGQIIGEIHQEPSSPLSGSKGYGDGPLDHEQTAHDQPRLPEPDHPVPPFDGLMHSL